MHEQLVASTSTGDSLSVRVRARVYVWPIFFLNVQFKFFLVVCVVYAYSMFGCLVASPLWHCRGQQQKQNSIGGPYHPPLWRCHSTEAQQACWVVEG